MPDNPPKRPGPSPEPPETLPGKSAPDEFREDFQGSEPDTPKPPKPSPSASPKKE